MTMDTGKTACSTQVTVGASGVGLRREDCQDGLLTGPEQTLTKSWTETCSKEEGEREERCRIEAMIPKRL